MLRVSFKKSREIGVSCLSLTGKIQSEKNDSPIQFESSLERDFVYILEFDKTVKRYIEQPIRIIKDQIIYTPDFYVEYWDDRAEIVEIKYQDDLINNKVALEKKFQLAREYCECNKMNFITLTEDDVRTHKLFNAKFLLNYLSPKQGYNQYDKDIIYRSMSKYKSIKVNDLVQECANGFERQAELLYVIWHMVANYYIEFDESKRLTMESKVWLK